MPFMGQGFVAAKVFHKLLSNLLATFQLLFNFSPFSQL